MPDESPKETKKEVSQYESTHDAMNRLRLQGFYIDGLAPAGDVIAFLVKCLAKTGRRVIEGKEVPGANAWLLEPLQRALNSRPAPGKTLVMDGCTIGYDPLEPPASADECVLQTMGAGVEVVVPLPRDGTKHPSITLPQLQPEQQ